MGKFRAYEPEHVWLLPPSVKDVLGEGHLSLFIHEMAERLDTSGMEACYSDEGQPGYHPKLLLKLWLYAYCLGVTSESAGGAAHARGPGISLSGRRCKPDHWTLNNFRRRHPRTLNDVFTQVVESARAQGWIRMRRVSNRFDPHCGQCLARPCFWPLYRTRLFRCALGMLQEAL